MAKRAIVHVDFPSFDGSAAPPCPVTLPPPSVEPDRGVPPAVTTNVVEAPTGLVTATTRDPITPQNPTGANLTITVAHEDVGDGRFRRRTRRTLPAGDPNDPARSTNYEYYAGVTHPGGETVPAAKGEANPCAANSTTINQGGAPHVVTAPAPDAGAPAIVRRMVYDAAGRVVASRVNDGPWTCTTYDPRGRVATVAISGLPSPRSAPPPRQHAQ